MQVFKYMLAVLGGGMVGASVALLMAPASGVDTRKRLSKRLDQERKHLSKQLDKQRQVLAKKSRVALDEAAEYLADEIHGATKKIVRMVGR